MTKSSFQLDHHVGIKPGMSAVCDGKRDKSIRQRSLAPPAVFLPKIKIAS